MGRWVGERPAAPACSTCCPCLAYAATCARTCPAPECVERTLRLPTPACLPACRAVVVGKDAVPRATVSNLSRLMDEMVTALARCKQPKLKVCL